VSDSDKIRVAVVGAGGIAKNAHLPSLADMEDVEIVAICDLIEERAKEKAELFKIPKTYTLMREMLANEKPEAVYALVEPSSLFHVARISLSEGFHTVLEKPPGVTSFQCRSLARAAEAAERILQVGFNRRHIPLVRRVVEIMREATTITQIDGRFMKNGTAAFDRGGLSSFPSDVIHVVDLVRDIAGGTPLTAATLEMQHDDVVPNAWNSLVLFENDVTATIRSNYKTGARFHSFEIHGPGASAFINIGFGGRECEAHVVTAKGEGAYSLAARGAGGVGMQTIDGRELAGSDKFYRFYGFYQEDRHFIDCVRSGATPITSIDDAVKTFELVDMIEAAIM
jgi:predicted dehydrogenase